MILAHRIQLVRDVSRLTRETYCSLLQTLIALQASLSRRFDGLDAGLSAVLLATIALAAFFGALTVNGLHGKPLAFPIVFIVPLILPFAAAGVGIARYRAEAEEPDATWLVNRMEIGPSDFGPPETYFSQAIERVRSVYEVNSALVAAKETTFLGCLVMTLGIIVVFAATWAFQVGLIPATLKKL